MQIHFSSLADRPQTARSLLLRQSLRDWCGSRRQARFTGTDDLPDGATPVAVLAGLSAFAPARHARTALFVGLANAPEAHLGRNILVCARPLRAEIEDFGLRLAAGGETGLPDLWWRSLLRNFHCAILLDRSDFAASAGFAPWIPLVLADRFPVVLPRRTDTAGADHVLILNHDPAADAQQMRRSYGALAETARLSVLSPETPAPADLAEMLAAPVHIHHGYSNHQRATGLSPFDSLANGIYTVVLPPEEATLGAVGHELQQEAATRGYALLTADRTAALAFARRALDRLAMLARGNMHINPEIQRLERLNAEYLAAMFGQFARQVHAE